jgi:hypothetical protein
MEIPLGGPVPKISDGKFLFYAYGNTPQVPGSHEIKKPLEISRGFCFGSHFGSIKDT